MIRPRFSGKKERYREYKFPENKNTLILEYRYLKDLVDINNEELKRFNNFGTWEDLYKPALKHFYRYETNSRPKTCIRIARKIIVTFFKLMIKDLIDNREVFDYPRGLGYLFVAEKNIKAGDKVFLSKRVPRICYYPSRRKDKMNSAYMFWRYNKKFYKHMKETIAKGEVFEKESEVRKRIEIMTRS